MYQGILTLGNLTVCNQLNVLERKLLINPNIRGGQVYSRFVLLRLGINEAERHCKYKNHAGN